MHSESRPQRPRIRASVIADRCDLMQLRSVGQKTPSLMRTHMLEPARLALNDRVESATTTPADEFARG